MSIVIALLVFLFGLIMGSFFNAVVWRFPRHLSLVRTRSVCVHCGRQLNTADLIPVLSFLLLRGRCRTCKRPIPWHYPLVEISTGLILLLPLAMWGLSWTFVLAAVLALLLELLFLFDLRYSVLPDEVALPALLVGTLVGLATGQRFESLALGGILGAGFFGFQYLVSRGRWIGAGDIRLGALMGLMLGWRNLLLALYLSYLIGATVSIVLILSRRRRWRGQMPFGTVLTAIAFILLLAAPTLSSLADRWPVLLPFPYFLE